MRKVQRRFADEVVKKIPETTYYILDRAEQIIRTVQVSGISENYIWIGEKPFGLGHNYFDYFPTVEELQEATAAYADEKISALQLQIDEYKKLKKQADDLTE